MLDFLGLTRDSRDWAALDAHLASFAGFLRYVVNDLILREARSNGQRNCPFLLRPMFRIKLYRVDGAPFCARGLKPILKPLYTKVTLKQAPVFCNLYGMERTGLFTFAVSLALGRIVQDRLIRALPVQRALGACINAWRILAVPALIRDRPAAHVHYVDAGP